jgi:archaellum component FlaC
VKKSEKNDIAKEVEKLKQELRQKKEEIHDLKKWINKEIDRDFSSDLEDFSTKELESLTDEYHALLDQDVDPVPDKTSITSHRKGIGKPVVWMKRFLLKMTRSYIALILGKQKSFNQKSVVLYQSLLVHQKKYHERINHIEERLGECEVRLRNMAKQLEEMTAKKTNRDLDHHQKKTVNRTK